MQQLWNRLETFLQENHPEIFEPYRVCRRLFI